jgi:hypothetical protein
MANNHITYPLTCKKLIDEHMMLGFAIVFSKKNLIT